MGMLEYRIQISLDMSCEAGLIFPAVGDWLAAREAETPARGVRLLEADRAPRIFCEAL